MSPFPHQSDDKRLTGSLNPSVVIQFFITLYVL